MKKLLMSFLLAGTFSVCYGQTQTQTILGDDAQVSSQPSAVTNPQFGQQQLVDPNALSQTQMEEQADLQKLGIPQQVQQLRQDIQDLRGLVEIQGHEMQQLQLQVQALEVAMKQQGKSVGTTQSSSSTSNSSGNDNFAGQTMYLQAYQLIQDKQYTPAIGMLKKYLSQYPNGNYAGDAHYWLGELYAVSGNGQSAITEFTQVVNNYPKSTKIPDAMLKLGIISYSEGQFQQAKDWYNKLMSQYPNSSAAQIASTELMQVEKAGH